MNDHLHWFGAEALKGQPYKAPTVDKAVVDKTVVNTFIADCERQAVDQCANIVVPWDWLEPLVLDVLATHHPRERWGCKVFCSLGDELPADSCGVFEDWASWREHVFDVMKARGTKVANRGR